MANDIQNSIYDAINTIINRQMDTLALDKTVIGIIDDIVDSTAKIYRIKYDGGYFNARSLSDGVFPKGMAVYVQIPQNDMANQKFIIGRAYEERDSEQADIVISTLNNYSIIGNSVLSQNKKISESGLPLRSYHNKADEKDENICDVKHRAQLLYSKNLIKTDDTSEKEELYYKINSEDLKIYSEKATAIMIEADFRTSLVDEQRYNSKGLYGLSLVLNFENSNYEYGNTQLDVFKYFEEKISATIQVEDDNDKTRVNTENDVTMASIRSIIDNGINGNISTWYDNNNNFTNTGKKELNKQINRAQKVIRQYEKTESVKFLPQAEKIMYSYLEELFLLRTYNNKTDLIEHYNAWKKIEIGQEENKQVSYILDSNNMVGNPMFFSSWSTQYAIFKVDFKHFKGIDSILFYHDGFNSNRNKEREDIFIKNLKLYVLQPISAVNGDYRLEIQAPDGLIFKKQASEETEEKIIKAKVTKKYYEDVTKNATYYWFKKNPSIINIGSNNYHSYGGVGWEYIGGSNNKGNYETLKLTNKENSVYKSTYKCVAEVDKTVILKEEFDIYNLSYETDLRIISNLGENFSFDSGIPLLTCEIKETKDGDYKENVDNNYRYYWNLKIDNSIIFLGENLESDLGDWIEWDSKNGCYKKKSTLDITISEALKQKRYEDLINIIQNVQFYNGETLITDKIDINKASRIKYPMVNVRAETSALFSCFVKKINNNNTLVDIGEAEIVLSNQGSSGSTNFNLVIENGDQVFQYDEYGNPPNSPKLKSPLEIKPLIPHLYAPNGVEIANRNYKVQWTFPIEDTLIEKTGLVLNPNDNDKESLDNNFQTIFSLAKSFNEDKLNNQIICRVFFEDQIIQKSTDFFFGKVGANGTNGTDVVAKIVPRIPSQVLDFEPVIFYKYKNGTDIEYAFNGRKVEGINFCGSDLSKFTVKLYQKNEEIPEKDNSTPPKLNYTVKWNIAGNPKTDKNDKYAKYLVFNSGNPNNPNTKVITWDEDQKDGQDVYIFRAQITYQEKTYYAFYGMPVIIYNGMLPNYMPITINRTTLLKEIIYNADGRNPIYNHNQGVEIINIPEGCTISWYAYGGKNNNETTADFKLLLERNGKKTDAATSFLRTTNNFIYVLPNDEYNGSNTNNRIVAYISKGNTLFATVIVPIHMSLNTFGLASLNAWDGVSVTIDEENGAVLAPQIGAGEKDKNNRFSGILMGKTETDTGHGKNAKEIGLFGYAHGLQSIFLDAKTGEAYFGLPDGYRLNEINNTLEPATGDTYNEGRIELKPGDVSKIGGWRLGRQSLYYTNSGEIGNKYSKDYIPTSSGAIQIDDNKIYAGHHIKDIKESDSGILIHAGTDPYLSIKGRLLDPENADKDILSVNGDSLLKKDDSLEIQLDPKTPTLFTIFRHNGRQRKKANGDILYPVGSRTFLAGINGRGELVANGLQDVAASGQGETITTFKVRSISAFGFGMDDETPYIGLSAGAGDDTIVKLFTKKRESLPFADQKLSKETTLYLSGASNKDNEYQRPLSLYGKNISLYADDDINDHRNKEITNVKIILSKERFFAGDESSSSKTYIKLLNDKTEGNSSSILVPNNFYLRAAGEGKNSDGNDLGSIFIQTRDINNTTSYSYLNLYREGNVFLKGWNNLYLTGNNNTILRTNGTDDNKSKMTLVKDGKVEINPATFFQVSGGTGKILLNNLTGSKLELTGSVDGTSVFEAGGPILVSSGDGIIQIHSGNGPNPVKENGKVVTQPWGLGSYIEIWGKTPYDGNKDTPAANGGTNKEYSDPAFNLRTNLGDFSIRRMTKDNASASDRFKYHAFYSTDLGIRARYGYFDDEYHNGSGVSLYAAKSIRTGSSELDKAYEIAGKATHEMKSPGGLVTIKFSGTTIGDLFDGVAKAVAKEIEDVRKLIPTDVLTATAFNNWKDDTFNKHKHKLGDSGVIITSVIYDSDGKVTHVSDSGRNNMYTSTYV